MRKLYSLVLIATALLIGTNAWGQFSTVQLVNHTNPSASKGYATLQEAIDAVAPGDTATITLLEEQNLTASIVIPNAVGESAQTFAARGKVVGRQPQRICLNLNGNDIVGDGALNQCCIALLKGVLHITGEGEIKKQGTEKGINSGWGRAAIAISGAPGNKNDDSKDFSKAGWWSTLIIDENVKVTAPDNFKSVGLAIMDIGGYMGTYYVGNQNFPAFIGVRQQSTTNNPTTDADDKLGYSDYNTYYNNADQTKKDALNIMWSRASNTNGDGTLQGSAFGVRVIVKGEIYGMNRGIFVFGPINQHPEDFPETGAHKETRTRYTIGAEHPYYYEHYFPWITLASTARVHCKASGTNDEEAGGIYAAGWAVWDISGEIYGQNGMYIKGGDIKLNDANVYSQDATYGNDGWRNGKVAGNGIFITTDEGYAGDMSVEVNGDSRIAGNGGVAIVEVVANVATTPDVNSVTINGGTIEGGSTGAIMVTEKTGNNTVAYGGTSITGITTKGGTESSVAATGTYVTEVIIDPVTNKTTVVISDLGAGNSVEIVTENLTETEEDYVKWTGTADQYILTDMTLEYLEMNPSPAVAQKIYVGDDTHQATLTVDRVVMGSLAQIIVAPGSKLIITGTDGIVAPSVDNIILHANESKQAIFLFHPEVSSNRHPNATVEFKSKAYLNGSKGVFQRFGVPTWNREDKTTSMKTASGTAKTWITQYDYVADDWAAWTPYETATDIVIANALPFRGYMLYSNNDKDHKKDYTFEGNLIGNQNENLHMYYGWNYFANSYTAPISIKDLIHTVMASLDADKQDYVLGTIYLYKNTGDDDYTWSGVNLNTQIKEFVIVDNAVVEVENQLTIQPMQAFLMRLNLIDGEMDQPISYKYDVYNPNMGIANNNQYLAPARSAQANNEMHVLVSGEGSWDKVYVVENNNFSNDFENGYDAYKYDGKTGVNLYAMNSDARMEILATDDAEGTFLGIDAPKAGNYTLHVAGVKGMEYAIVDMENNTVFEAVDGAKYEFYANAGVNDYRFQVVAAAKMPTAIENTEDIKKVNGVYTITGQFLGNDLNALPAGVYIVNGVKVVK